MKDLMVSEAPSQQQATFVTSERVEVTVRTRPSFHQKCSFGDMTESISFIQDFTGQSSSANFYPQTLQDLSEFSI